VSGISLARRRVGCQVRPLEKLLNDEIRSRARTSQTQARVFSEEVQAVLHRPALAKIARELVESIRTDLTVAWADRAATKTRIRAEINRLLRKHKSLARTRGWWRL